MRNKWQNELDGQWVELLHCKHNDSEDDATAEDNRQHVIGKKSNDIEMEELRKKPAGEDTKTNNGECGEQGGSSSSTCVGQDTGSKAYKDRMNMDQLIKEMNERLRALMQRRNDTKQKETSEVTNKLLTSGPDGGVMSGEADGKDHTVIDMQCGAAGSDRGPDGRDLSSKVDGEDYTVIDMHDQSDSGITNVTDYPNNKSYNLRMPLAFEDLINTDDEGSLIEGLGEDLEVEADESPPDSSAATPSFDEEILTQPSISSEPEPIPPVPTQEQVPPVERSSCLDLIKENIIRHIVLYVGIISTGLLIALLFTESE